MISKLNVNEQEISLCSCRDEDVIHMYCSDNTWITKMDKLVAKSPELFTVIAETDWGKSYEFPKRLLSIRSSIVQRHISDEQKKRMSEQLQNARKAKTNKQKENK